MNIFRIIALIGLLPIIFFMVVAIIAIIKRQGPDGAAEMSIAFMLAVLFTILDLLFWVIYWVWR